MFRSKRQYTKRVYSMRMFSMNLFYCSVNQFQISIDWIYYTYIRNKKTRKHVQALGYITFPGPVMRSIRNESRIWLRWVISTVQIKIISNSGHSPCTISSVITVGQIQSWIFILVNPEHRFLSRLVDGRSVTLHCTC